MNKVEKMVRVFLMVFLSMLMMACDSHIKSSAKASASTSIKAKAKDSLNFPVAQTWQTEEGLIVWFLRDNSLPIVDMRLTFKAGSAQPAAFAGLASLTNQLIGHGTADMDETQFSLQLDNLGIDSSLSSHRDMAIVSMRALSGENFERGVSILKQVLTKPAFPASGLARAVANRRVLLERNKSLPARVVSKAFWQGMYQQHPYAQPTGGTLESLQQIKREHVQAFYQTYYVARNGVLVIVGALSRQEAEKTAKQISQSLPQHNKALPTLPQAMELVASVPKRQHNELNSNQNHIRIGQLALPRSHPDYIALYTANQVLGGGALTSVLGNEIREQRGWAYSVGSYLQPMLAGGPWLIYMQTANETTEAAIEKTLEVVKNFEQEITEQRIHEAVQYLRGSFALNIDSNSELLSYLSLMAFYDLPVNYLSDIDQQLANLTHTQVKEAWKKHFNPDKLWIISAGKKVQQSKVERASEKPTGTRRH